MRRNILLLLTLSFGIFSCSNSAIKINGQKDKELQFEIEKKIENASNVSFKKIKGQAILVGNSIKLLDNNLKVIEDISNLTTKFVEITGISDSLFNDTKEICNAYWYVQIRTSDKEGIVNGRQVFKIESSNQDTTILLNGKRLEFLTTACLAMGIEYQGDLMDCPTDQPLIVRDEKNNFYGLVEVVPNDFYKKAISNTEFKYFQLRSDAGFLDIIVSLEFHESTIKLKIHRQFQEGENDYQVLLRYDRNKYTAEYLNYGEIKYE